MKIIFEKDMAPEVIDAWNYYKELDKGLSAFMGAPDEPECHAFVFDCEHELDSLLSVGMIFLRGFQQYGSVFNKVNLYAFLYETSNHENRGSFRGYCIWFADANGGSKDIIAAIHHSCEKELLGSFKEFLARQAKLRVPKVTDMPVGVQS